MIVIFFQNMHNDSAMQTNSHLLWMNGQMVRIEVTLNTINYRTKRICEKIKQVALSFHN